MGKSDRTGKSEAIRTVEKGKHTGKIAPLSAGKQATAKTGSKEEINGQRTMRKVEQKMKKTIFEEMGGTYVRQGDYFIPCLTLPAEKENKPIGIWGQRHKRYLREHKRATYTTLLTSGKLNSYLADIDEQAEEMFSRLVNEYADRQGVTEQLKAENQLEWVQKMNSIRNRAVEIVNTELIYM